VEGRKGGGDGGVGDGGRGGWGGGRVKGTGRSEENFLFFWLFFRWARLHSAFFQTRKNEIDDLSLSIPERWDGKSNGGLANLLR